MGADQESRGSVSVEAEGRRWRRHGAGCARSKEEARADDGYGRPRAARGSRLRENLAAVPQKPAGVRRKIREGLVQAYPPRHGADPALSRQARAERAADLARPDPRGEPPADRWQGYRGPQGEDPRDGTV